MNIYHHASLQLAAAFEMSQIEAAIEPKISFSIWDVSP